MKFWRYLFDLLFKIPDDLLPYQVEAIVGIGAGLGFVMVFFPPFTEIPRLTLSQQSYAVVNKVKNFYYRFGDNVAIFFSGGYRINKISEAEEMSHCFLEEVVDPPPHIDMETKSRNSRENVKNTIDYLREKNYKSAIIVDFYGHLKQIKMLFLQELKRQNIKDIKLYFIGAEADYGENVQTRLKNPFNFLVWEILTTVYYYLTSYLPI